MDIKYKIIAEEFKWQMDFIMGSQILDDRQKKANILAIKTLAISIATRFILCDLSFDSKEFLTACGVK